MLPVKMEDRSKISGSALVYILVAIALLAALTATFMGSSSQNESSGNALKTFNELNAQIRTIRSAIQECVLTYPGGDKSPGYSQTNAPYPINPNSTYFNGATPGPSASIYAEGARCPGNPGNSNNHARIFGLNSGKFFPAGSVGFNLWRYYNGTDGVYISVATNRTDAYMSTALAKLDDQFAECEADIVDAMTPNALVRMTSDDSNIFCAAGYKCFRIWLIANPSNVYLGDTDGDEAACP